MKAIVDPQRCQGHTLCNLTAPDIFTLDETDGHARAIDGDVPTDQEADVRMAVRAARNRPSPWANTTWWDERTSPRTRGVDG